MTADEKKEMEELRAEVKRLQELNSNLVVGAEQLIKRNMELTERLDAYYHVKMRVDWLKELVRKHREMLVNADLRNDEELLAMIEARIEGDDIPLPPEYGIAEVAELVGVTQKRIAELYRKKTIYHTVDKYLDYLRLQRALRLIKEHPGYNIEAIAMEAGFNTVRTLNRKIQDVIGITPGQFRDITHPKE